MTNGLKEFYSSKSTEELEEIIRLDVDYGGEHGLSQEALTAILEVLQDRNYNEERGVAHLATWEDFEKHYLPGLEDRAIRATQIDPADINASLKRRRLSPILRAACIVLVTVLAVGVISTTANAMGYDIWGAVVSWTEDTLRFSFSGDIPTVRGYSGEYDTLQEALEAHCVKEPLAPTWLPNGYALEEISVSEDEGSAFFVGTYSKTSGERIGVTIVRYAEPIDILQHEKDTDNVDVYTVHGIDHYISGNYDMLRATWINQNCEVWISGDISQQEMQEVIDSIYER